MKAFQGRVARVRCLAYSPDGDSLASAGNGGVIRLWDTRQGRCRCRFRASDGRVTGLAYSPDGSQVASATDYLGANLWSATDGKVVGMLHDRQFAATSVEYRPDGRSLLTSGLGRVGRAARGIVATWDLRTNKPTARFTAPPFVWSPTFSPDGSLVAMGASGAGILFWDPARFPDGTPIPGPPDYVVPEVLRAGGSSPLRRWTIPQKPEPRCVRFSPDGRLLAATSGWSAHVHDVRDGRKVATLRGHRQVVKSLDFAPDGRTLASASHDGTVRFWDPEAGDERACYDWDIGAVDCAVFAPDGMTIAVGGEGGIVAWDVE